MKVLIEIPDHIYNGLKDNENIIRTTHLKFDGSIGLQAQLTILDGTILPDNATNGEVFEKIYDVWDWKKSEYTIDVFMANCVARFSLEWWNAPYKKGE